MASSIPRTITVPIAADLEPMRRQLGVLRDLFSEMSAALDAAILALDEPDTWPDADVQQFDGSPAPCPDCNGTGVADWANHAIPCGTCNGTKVAPAPNDGGDGA